MMKMLLTIILLVGMVAPVQEPALAEVRSLYKHAAEEEEAARKLMKLLEPYGDVNPLFLGYRAAGNMMMAKHVGNPFSKMSHFKKGKEMFSTAIKADEENAELRFLRFSVQAEAPAFLGYRDNLEEDKELILLHFKNIKDEQLRQMISGYLLSSEALTVQEKKRLKKAISEI